MNPTLFPVFCSLLITDRILFLTKEAYYVFENRPNVIYFIFHKFLNRQVPIFFQPVFEGIYESLPFLEDGRIHKLSLAELNLLKGLTSQIVSYPLNTDSIPILDERLNPKENFVLAGYLNVIRDVQYSPLEDGIEIKIPLLGIEKKLPIFVYESDYTESEVKSEVLRPIYRNFIPKRKKGGKSLEELENKETERLSRRELIRRRYLERRRRRKDGVEGAERVEEKITNQLSRSGFDGFDVPEGIPEVIDEDAERDREGKAKSINDLKFSPFEGLFARFLLWLSSMTKTPFPVYVKALEGERIVIPSFLGEYGLSPDSWDYYTYVDKILKGEDLTAKIQSQSNKNLPDWVSEEYLQKLTNYLAEKERKWSIKKVKNTETLKSLSEIAEEGFKRFIDTGDLLSLKISLAAASLGDCFTPSLLSYAGEVFGVSKKSEIRRLFLTDTERAVNSLKVKAKEFLSATFPAVDEELYSFDGKVFLSAKVSEKEYEPNSFSWFLNSLDLSTLPKEAVEFINDLKENFESRDEPLYSFNFIS